MSTLSRRNFLVTAALAAPTLRLLAQGGNGPVAVALTLPTEALGAKMPADFVGLSYEIQQLTDPKFFSLANTGLIRAFRQLSAHGVLRLGGNTSEFGYWKPTADAPEPAHPATREVAGEPKAEYYAVTPEAVRNLAAFLKATGWSCLYGIGMGTNTPERAADEAVFVAKTLGASLQYFQIGNEVDLFDRHLRDPKTWTPKAYLDEWLAIARAVTARVPEARFGLPDVASDVTWLPQIATLWPAVENPPHVTTLSHHHYFDGPATNPHVTIENLLKAESMRKVQHNADLATGAADAMHLRVRMTEGNTCYRGGKPGVSDVFAAALWSADYSLLLASNNYSGINLHGGTGKSVANSVGGFLPGDGLLREQGKSEAEIATHPHPFYTPIGTFGDKYIVQPVGIGLGFAGKLSGATFLKADLTAPLQSAGINATAYAARLANGRTSLVIINKDLEKDLALTVDFGTHAAGLVHAETLRAPSADSREAHIEPEAKPRALKAGKLAITVPHTSALRLTLEKK
jgi:hypothetical protein